MDNRARGRGAAINTPNKFFKHEIEYTSEDWQQWEDPEVNPKTQFIEEESKTLMSVSDSPDLPNFHSINPYRGCEHGCVYCYARPSHSYLNLSPGLDFETRLVAKHNAAELLHRELAARTYRVAHVAIGIVRDDLDRVRARDTCGRNSAAQLGQLVGRKSPCGELVVASSAKQLQEISALFEVIDHEGSTVEADTHGGPHSNRRAARQPAAERSSLTVRVKPG